ncbi:uncharacterized protein LOC126410661 [Nymphaea colorata]|nr:uncharacterized protein LOC126410661 [Nymphaea colorata]
MMLNCVMLKLSLVVMVPMKLDLRLELWRLTLGLLDVSAELPQLIRRPGLKTWKVWDKGCWLTSYEEVPSNRKAVIVPSMFPSGQAGEPREASAFGEEEISVNVNELQTDTSLQKQCQIDENFDENFPLERGNCDVGDGIASSKTCEENETEKFCSQSITPRNPKPKAKEVSNFPLERCMRILPHDQNGGAFSIAVLQKFLIQETGQVSK